MHYYRLEPSISYEVRISVIPFTNAGATKEQVEEVLKKVCYNYHDKIYFTTGGMSGTYRLHFYPSISYNSFVEEAVLQIEIALNDLIK